MRSRKQFDAARNTMARVKNPLKILYLDIETTPHKGTFWNLFPKYIPLNQMQEPTYMMCWAAKWEGERDVIFRKKSDPDHIGRLWELLDEADTVIHYNGKSFDIKHINREFAAEGLAPPSPYSQVDLLTAVRASFRMASNKLDYVVRYFGLGKKVVHVGIELWYDCMDGCPKAWKLMEKYNRRDVVLLPKLYKFMQPWIKSHPNAALAAGDPTRPTCSTCGSTHVQSRGNYHTKTGIYERFQCMGCSTWLRRRKAKSSTNDNVLIRAN